MSEPGAAAMESRNPGGGAVVGLEDAMGALEVAPGGERMPVATMEQRRAIQILVEDEWF